MLKKILTLLYVTKKKERFEKNILTQTKLPIPPSPTKVTLSRIHTIEQLHFLSYTLI